MFYAHFKCFKTSSCFLAHSAAPAQSVTPGEAPLLPVSGQLEQTPSTTKQDIIR